MMVIMEFVFPFDCADGFALVPKPRALRLLPWGEGPRRGDEGVQASPYFTQL